MYSRFIFTPLQPSARCDSQVLFSMFRTVLLSTLVALGATCLGSCSTSKFSYLKENVKGYGAKGPIVVLATQVHGKEQAYPMWLRQDPNAPTTWDIKGQAPQAIDAVDQWLPSGFGNMELISVRRVDSLFMNTGLKSISEAVSAATKHFNADAAVLVSVENFGVSTATSDQRPGGLPVSFLHGTIYITMYNTNGDALWQVKHNGTTPLPPIPNYGLASQSNLSYFLSNSFADGLVRSLLDIKNKSSE